MWMGIETRFIGFPLVLMRGGTRVPLPGTIDSSAIPDHGNVSYRGAEYRVFSVKGEAFPAGALRMSVLVPVPPPSSTRSCPAVSVLEMGRLVKQIWRRFRLIGASAASFVKSTPGLTGTEIYVRRGSRQLAGSHAPGPPHILDEGTVSYEGVTFGVTSFPGRSTSGHVRVYVLLAP